MQLENFITSKMIRCVCIVLLLVVSVRSQNVPGIRLGTFASRATTTTTIPTTCEAGLRFGCSDCNTQLICDHTSTVIGTFKCTTSAPYCLDGQCGSTRNSSCTSDASSSNLCPGTAGYFPNPTSCTRFNYCDEFNVATEYICPTYLVYDPVNGGCKRRVSSADCPTINCYWNRNKYLPYPLEKSLYWYCSANNVASLFQCPALADGTGFEEFDSDVQGCSSDICTSAGIFADSTDNTKYYYCVLTATADVYDKYVQSCATGLVFSDKRCVDPTTTSTASATTTLGG